MLSLNRSYLECLVSIPALRAKGILMIQHKQPKHYYEALLGRFKSDSKAILDDNPAKSVKLTDGAHAPAARFSLILRQQVEDGEQSEGEPSTEDDGDDGPGTKVLEHLSWGKFASSLVRRQTTTGFVMQYEATCPHHRDIGDKPGTTCRRTKAFHTDLEKETTLKVLKNWCLQGRRCDCRARGGFPHKDLDAQHMAVLSDDHLDRLLMWAETQPTWVCDAAPMAAARPAPGPVLALPAPPVTSSTSSSSDSSGSG